MKSPPLSRSAYGWPLRREPAPSSEKVLVLEPGRAERNYWRDLWHYRELFAILAWRDVAVRYKQTVIGVAWAVVRPLLTMVVFTVVFGKLAKLPSDGDAPYPVLVFAGMLPWFLFSSILSEASNSLVGNANLISKVYFPRLIIPASAGGRGARRFRDQPRDPVRRSWPGTASCPTGRSCSCRVFVVLAVLASLGPGALHHGAQRQVPRLPLHHPVHRPVRALCLAGRLLERRRARAVALLVQPQPDGRRDRRLPLVPARRREPALPAGLPASASASSRFFLWLGVRYFRRTERTFADLI